MSTSFEARRRRAQQQQESAAETLRSVAEAERRERTQRLVRLGAPVDLAGLGDWPDDVLLGAMLAVAMAPRGPDWPTREASWRTAAAEFRAQRQAQRTSIVRPVAVPVAVRFPPGRQYDERTRAAARVRRTLARLGLTWVSQLHLWVGDVDLDAAHEIVTRYGGVIERQDGVPDGATPDADAAAKPGD